MISIADKKFRGRDKIVQKMTKDGLVDENLRTGEQKSATAAEKPEQEDSAKETAEKETDEAPVVEEELCMDAEDGEEESPRHHSTAKQSADYYKAHQEDGKPKDAPAESDAEPQTKKGRLSFEDEKGGIVRGVGMGVKKVAKKGVDTATGFAHQKVHQVEKDNSGVEAAHKSEEAAERLHHFVKGRKKPKDKSARAEKRGGEDQKSSRLKFSESEGGTAENAAEPSLKRSSHSRLPQEVKQKQSARSFTRKSSIRMPMQQPSAVRKPELPPASRQQRQQTPLRRKRKRRCRRSSCSTKPYGSVLVLVSFW